jgi:hypothetical protein
MMDLLHQSSVVYGRALLPVIEGEGSAGGDKKKER